MTGTTSNTGTSSSNIYVTTQAKASVIAAINKAHANNSAKRLFNEAEPAIVKVISRIACGMKGSRIRAYSDPDASTLSFLTPLSGMDYHKSGCLNVLRINGIQKKSANAVKFFVDYISPQSEETQRRSYTAIKQPSGEWLFDWGLS